MTAIRRIFSRLCYDVASAVAIKMVEIRVSAPDT